ncbi:hypothetical protein BACI9J_250001 [Bacillus altitudinis]|nr:hypothetical protein BACI9J_250001 [Bacillus altitudinis]
MVRQRRARGVEDRVVVAATQTQRDLAGDGGGDPALQRLTEHQGLRVEPATFVHQATETATLVVVRGDGVLVVDRVEQALVGDVQQRHARRLVDAAALRLDDAVLDLVGRTQAVAATDGVRLVDQGDRVGVLDAVDRDGATGLEPDADDLGRDLDVVTPGRDTHDRLDDVQAAGQLFEALRLVRRAPDVRVGRVRLLGGVAVREPTGDEPLAHLLAAAELLDELGVEPRLVDAQARVGHQAVAVEPLDVVALVGGAVAPDVDAVFLHRTDEHRARHRATERRRVEVRLAAGADVERTGLQCDQAFFDQGALRVDQPGDLRAVLVGAARDGVDVRLVVLADVSRVRAGDRSLLAHPGNGAGGVETP